MGMGNLSTFDWKAYRERLYGVAANKSLLEHYVEHLGARSIGRLDAEAYRFLIYGKAISKLEEVYTYDDSEV